MQINISKAVKQFFPSPSLEQVYFEAVANALDAGASEIAIEIKLDSFSESNTLNIVISDNGKGFTDKNFRKFSKLLETEEEHHKGLGRLVFLCYFEKIEVESTYGGWKRKFTFDDNFEGTSNVTESPGSVDGTKLTFIGYRKSKVKSYDYLRPPAIRKDLELHFFPILHSLKINESPLRIDISVSIKEENPDYNFVNEKVTLDVSGLPDLQSKTFKSEYLDLFESFTIYYSIKENIKKPSLITAVIAENRTISLDIISKERLPGNYEVIFLLYSEYFNGKVNSSRQKLDIDDSKMQTVRQILIEQIGEVLDQSLPQIRERNEKVEKSLDNRYPHLSGFFPKQVIGLIDRNKAIEQAQKRFFREQKEILEAENLDDKQFEKSLEVSSRVLMEYILYRGKIIMKLKEINERNSEADIHNLIVPMRKTLRRESFLDDIYSNNAWLLDDKFMAYSKILSDQEMSKLISEIALEEEEVAGDDTRPDISLIFSGDPSGGDSEPKVDVVVVEVKKKGLPLAKREEVFSQLRQRARKLLQYYPNRIQRIWFYGIVDFSPELKRSLLELEFTEIYSKDKVYYKEVPILPIDNDTNYKVLTGFHLISFDALIGDAEIRNETFLKILKETIRKHSKEN